MIRPLLLRTVLCALVTTPGLGLAETAAPSAAGDGATDVQVSAIRADQPIRGEAPATPSPTAFPLMPRAMAVVVKGTPFVTSQMTDGARF